MAADPDGPRQLPLDLALPARRGADDYVVGDANRAAHDLVCAWPDWPSPVVLLVGPEGAGKSHLAAIWAERAGARVVPAGRLADLDPVALAGAPVVVEDLGPGLDETALFHLINAARQSGRPLLLTARKAPAAWAIALPDLASRLRAATPATLDEPDDALLEAVLAKLFADRQTTVDPQVPRFLARRIERSYRAANLLVDALDRAALAAKAPITKAFAARLIRADWAREPELPGLDGEAESDHNPS